MIDPARVARDLAKEILAHVVGAEDDVAELERELVAKIEARIRAEYLLRWPHG